MHLSLAGLAAAVIICAGTSPVFPQPQPQPQPPACCIVNYWSKRWWAGGRWGWMWRGRLWWCGAPCVDMEANPRIPLCPAVQAGQVRRQCCTVDTPGGQQGAGQDRWHRLGVKLIKVNRPAQDMKSISENEMVHSTSSSTMTHAVSVISRPSKISAVMALATWAPRSAAGGGMNADRLHCQGASSVPGTMPGRPAHAWCSVRECARQITSCKKVSRLCLHAWRGVGATSRFVGRGKY